MAYTTKVPATGPIKIGEVMNHFGVAAPKKMSKLYRGGGHVPEGTVNAAVPLNGQLKGANMLGTTKLAVKSIADLPSTKSSGHHTVYVPGTAIPEIQLDDKWNDQPLTWTYIETGSTVNKEPTIDATTKKITVYGRAGGYTSTIKLKASYSADTIAANGFGDGTGYKTVTLTVTELGVRRSLSGNQIEFILYENEKRVSKDIYGFRFVGWGSTWTQQVIAYDSDGDREREVRVERYVSIEYIPGTFSWDDDGFFTRTIDSWDELYGYNDYLLIRRDNLSGFGFRFDFLIDASTIEVVERLPTSPDYSERRRKLEVGTVYISEIIYK